MTVDAPQPGQPVTELWTYFVMDPVGIPLSRRLARLSVVTPNRLTLTAGVLGLAAAVCFATGRLRLGGLLFLLRFFVDCLDGTVARIQGSSSARGASLDPGIDVVGVTAAYATLGWYLVDTGRLDVAWLLVLLGSLVVYNYLLEHRKRLAARAGLGHGGSSHRWTSSWSVLRRWVAFCNSRKVSTVPWTAEVEIATLGLAQLLLPADALPWAIAAALAFYVFANLLNARRVWKIAGRIDRQPALEQPGASS